ncbi:MAG: CapA family protein [Prevotella sp.]|nr:CapA family protein [Prevotella sp.]
MTRIVIAADFVPINRVKDLASQGRYEEVLGETKTLFADYDYRLVNVECPMAPEGAKPIVKCGPNLSCDEQSLKMVAWAGFDCACLANNHFYDYGDEGVKATLKTLKQLGLDYVGGGADLQEAGTTLYKKIGGETLALINCTEHESSIATKQSAGSNPFDPIEQYHAILEARQKADYVVVITHGGVEHYDHPTPRMRQAYRFFIEVGADAVVNHHQHCFCGYEYYKGKPIFYGLGNFCFDKPQYRDCFWNEGYVVGLTLDKDSVECQVFPYMQCSKTPSVHFLQGEERSHFMEKLEEKSRPIADSEALEEVYRQYLERTSNRYDTLFTPYSNKFTEALCEKGLLPTCISKGKWPKLLNKIECESHRDRLIHFIKKHIE